VILQALGSRVNEKTIGLRTQLSIAEEMGVSRTTVAKHEKKLIEYGYVTKTRLTIKGRQNKYQYTFNLKMIEYPVKPHNLISFRERIEMIYEAKSETPNGVKQRHPQKVKKSETPNSDTRIDSKKKIRNNGFQGAGSSKSNFKSISVCGDSILAKMEKDGFANKG